MHNAFDYMLCFLYTQSFWWCQREIWQSQRGEVNLWKGIQSEFFITYIFPSLKQAYRILYHCSALRHLKADLSRTDLHNVTFELFYLEQHIYLEQHSKFDLTFCFGIFLLFNFNLLLY